MDALIETIKSECGFLRIQSHALDTSPSWKVGRRGVTANLRFFVSGLPWAKRSKWLQPLLWSVAVMLKKSDVDVVVKGGKLKVFLGAGFSVHVDFAAAR